MALLCHICGDVAPVSPGTIDLAALGVTWVAMIWFAGRAGLSRGLSLFAGLAGMVAALWAGRLYVLLEHGPDALLHDPDVLLQLLPGGKAMMGALPGAAIAGYLLLRIRRKPFLIYADAWVPALVLGYVVARLGCFVNGDDFGVVSSMPWAVRFPPGTEAYATHLARGWIAFGGAASLPVHPTELYHVLAGIAAFIFLVRWRPRWPGQRLALAMACGGLARLLIEFLRDDYWLHGELLDVPQWCSLLLIVLALGLWWYQRGRQSAGVVRAAVSEAGT